MICEERIGDRSGGYWGQPPDARRSKIIPPPVNKTLGRTVLFLALITLTLIHLAQAQVQVRKQDKIIDTHTNRHTQSIY